MSNVRCGGFGIRTSGDTEQRLTQSHHFEGESWFDRIYNNRERMRKQKDLADSRYLTKGSEIDHGFIKSHIMELKGKEV